MEHDQQTRTVAMRVRAGGLVGLSLCAIALAGCGRKEDASERNFGAAISRFLEQTGDLCLGLSIRQWPIDILNARQFEAAKLIPIETAGLVSSEAVLVDQVILFGQRGVMPAAAKRYQLTEKGKSFFRWVVKAPLFANVEAIKDGDFCYGKQALAKVRKWDGPVTQGLYPTVLVTYAYVGRRLEVRNLRGAPGKAT